MPAEPVIAIPLAVSQPVSDVPTEVVAEKTGSEKPVEAVVVEPATIPAPNRLPEPGRAEPVTKSTVDKPAETVVVESVKKPVPVAAKPTESAKPVAASSSSSTLLTRRSEKKQKAAARGF